MVSRTPGRTECQQVGEEKRGGKGQGEPTGRVRKVEGLMGIPRDLEEDQGQQ